MKKYNGLIAVSVLVYILLAVAAGYGVKHTAGEKDQAWKVEINRIYTSLSGGAPLDKLNLHWYDHVKRVTWLSVEDAMEEAQGALFYEEDNQLESEIKPLFENDRLKGYLRFDYQEPEFDTGMLLVLVQICLALLELFLLALLRYLKSRLIRPFQQLSSLPQELACGHFKGIVKEENNKFFGRFLWGIGQLKDTLDASKKRQMELEKEKKKLLLSLSHDIKTPLGTIKLYGNALENKMYDSEAQRTRAAHQIGVKAEEIERYVEEIMKTSREDILDIRIEEGEFYLDQLMKQVLATYGEKCRIRLVELEVGAYEDRLLKGDLQRAAEVLENLFENAFKYGDGRRIEITFFEEDYCQLIRVFNSGSVVSDNDFNHIFESFFRAGNSEGIPGTGLGLYICREIMRKMGGEIFAQKEEGGMAFVLVFG